MKNIKNIFIAVIFPVVLISYGLADNYPVNQYSHGYDSLIIIKSSRSVYLESEPIWIEVEVNIPKEIVLDRDLDIQPNGGEAIFYLTDESGDTLKYLSGIASSVLIKEYRSHYYSLFHLQYFYGTEEDFPNSDLGFRYKLLPGIYSLQARVGLHVKKKIKYYFSNLISFTVEKPTGEELDAQKKLIEIEDYAVNTGKSTEKTNGILKKVIEFRNLYPQSRYLPKAEDMIIGFCLYESEDSLVTYILRNIKENPDNYYNKSLIGCVISHFKGYEETIISTLKEINKSANSTLLQKFIDNYIEELNFRKYLEKE